MKKAQSVTSQDFKKYGMIHEGYQVDSLCKEAEKIDMPESGCLYEASIPTLEATADFQRFIDIYAGEQAFQCGMCWGHNKHLDGVEYHRASEILVAVTDMVVMLGDRRDLDEEFRYNSELIEAFSLPKGSVVELFATTLHLAPSTLDPTGFRCIVILPRGTNEPLSEEGKEITSKAVGEHRLLFARDKWLLFHPDTDGAKKGGIYPGVYGENYKLGETVLT